MTTSKTGREGESHRECHHLCAEHSYTNYEVALLVDAIREEVLRLRSLHDQGEKQATQLMYSLADTQTALANGSPLPVQPMQYKSEDAQVAPTGAPASK